MNPIGWLYRSWADKRYYVFCPKCMNTYGDRYRRNATLNPTGGLWPIYSEQISKDYYLNCCMINCKIGDGSVELFDRAFLRGAYKEEFENEVEV